MQGSKMYVGNLSYQVTEEQLTELFKNYGAVTNVSIIAGRGFGFVEMASPEEATQAQEGLNETEFQGRALRIDEARAPKPRDYGDGGGGGYHRQGGPGGSRDHSSRGGRDNRRGGGSRDRSRGGQRGGGGRDSRYGY